MLKIEKMTLFGEFKDLNGTKVVWWRKYRHGTTLLLTRNTGEQLITFIENCRPIIIEGFDGRHVCYDLANDIEMYN